MVCGRAREGVQYLFAPCYVWITSQDIAWMDNTPWSPDLWRETDRQVWKREGRKGGETKTTPSPSQSRTVVLLTWTSALVAMRYHSQLCRQQPQGLQIQHIPWPGASTLPGGFPAAGCASGKGWTSWTASNVTTAAAGRQRQSSPLFFHKTQTQGVKLLGYGQGVLGAGSRAGWVPRPLAHHNLDLASCLSVCGWLV